MLKGPYIAGSNVLPANLATYQPWVFNWHEKEKEIEKLKSSYNRTGKANTLSSLRSITDEVIVEREEYAKVVKTKGKGKCALRKEKSTAPSSKKRKVRSPSPSNSHSDESFDDDDDDDDNSFANKDSLPESSMTQLFSIFSDSMQAIGDDHLTNTCKALANICDAPLLDGDDSLCRVSRSVTPSFLNSLGILTGKASFAVASDLEKRHVYGLSDEATLIRTFPNSMDNDTLLEHLNNSLNNFSNDKIKSLSLNEPRSKLRHLEIDHRSSLGLANKFKRFYLDSKEEINILRTKNSGLIDDKDHIAIQGAQTLAKFHEALLEVQIERDEANRKNVVLSERESQVRSRLLIINDDEFAWAAKVLDDARNNLGVNVSLQAEHTVLVRDMISDREGAEERFRKIIEELEAEKKQLVKNLSSRNDKCSRLKNQLKITVANFRNDAVLFRNQTIKMVCDDHNILHSAYPCLSDEVPKNVPNLVISDSEAGEYEDEESDEDEEEEKSDEDDEESIKK